MATRECATPNRRHVALALGALPGAALLLAGCSETVTEHGPARVAHGVLRVASDQGDRLAFISSQWERRRVYVGGSRTGGSRRTVAHLHLDFWLIDVATARPLRRVRLVTAKQLGNMAVLGADRGVLWARLPDLIGCGSPTARRWLRPQRHTLMSAGANVWDGILDQRGECATKPVEWALQDGTFAPWAPGADEVAQLKKIFPEGVCD